VNEDIEYASVLRQVFDQRLHVPVISQIELEAFSRGERPDLGYSLGESCRISADHAQTRSGLRQGECDRAPDTAARTRHEGDSLPR
jgi:hypothetical protein